MSVAFSTFLDSPDLTGCFSADASLASINEQAGAAGLYFPLFLDESRSLIDHLACGSHLPASHRFGTLADNILGMNFQLCDGRKIRMGGRSIKNCTGFDINRFVLNSRHVFGRATEFVLRLRALPGPLQWFRFRTAPEEIESFRRSLSRSPWWHSLECVDVEIRAESTTLWVGFRGAPDRASLCRAWLRSQLSTLPVEEIAPVPVSLGGDALIKTLPSRAVAKALSLGGEARIHLTTGFIRWSGEPKIEDLARMRSECVEEGGHLISRHLPEIFPADEEKWTARLEAQWQEAVA